MSHGRERRDGQGGDAGLGALHRADAQALQQGAPGNVLGELLNRNAGLDAPDVRLAEHQLVEGNVAGRTESDLRKSNSHVGNLHDGRPKAFLSTYDPSAERAAFLFL
jgi:hypothetical protein